jgi:hypothetical protein
VAQELEGDFRGDGIGEVRDDLIKFGEIDFKSVACYNLYIPDRIEAVVQD